MMKSSEGTSFRSYIPKKRNKEDQQPPTSTLGSAPPVERKSYHRGDDEAATEIASRLSSLTAYTSDSSRTLARRETKLVDVLRLTLFVLLLTTASLAGAGVYLFTKDQEHDTFARSFEANTFQVIDSFLSVVEHSLGAIGEMSSSITSFALETNQTFPFVTIPDFAIKGSNVRVQSGTHIVHYMPLISDSDRAKWESYAMENRFHIDDAYEQDSYFREKQDSSSDFHRLLQDDESTERNVTLLDDGTYYHPRIWTVGATEPEGDIPGGRGPYLPLWHRSPINSMKQGPLNQDFLRLRFFSADALQIMDQEHVAMMNAGIKPGPTIKSQLEANLKLSQFRHQVDEYVDDISTFLTYPVSDTFEDSQKLAGVLATNLYWKVLFSNLLPHNAKGIICVVSNSFDQTFSYRIDGPSATFLGMGDLHDTKYDDHEYSADINSLLQSRADASNRAYTTVPLSRDFGHYKLRIYPSEETEAEFTSNKPVIYTVIVVCTFAFTSLIFFLFNLMVEKRQHLMMRTALAAATKAATTERELNEFLSHEVRNPLSAAISACTFVQTTINEADLLSNAETQKELLEDLDVVESSLHFINDFLRSMIDVHRSDDKKLTLNLSPTDILHDIFHPVSTMLFKRDATFELRISCPDNLVVTIDSLRLKQVVLNLVRNATKFVESGFIRLRAEVVEGLVRIYVEDSGPGIPLEKRQVLFSKFQASLDCLGQGTGLGLALSKTLMIAMDGNLLLDEEYDSGIDGCPGTCFVIDLNVSPDEIVLCPLDLETGIPVIREELRECDSTRNSISSKSSNLEDSTITNVATSKSTQDSSTVDMIKLPENISVLFVDDDVILRRLFVRAIQKVQPTWKVQEAASGEVAIKICETNEFDLIFMDQYMASVDKQMLGTEVCRVMRQKGINSVLCGLSANDMEEAFLKAGADSFIHKPMPCKKDELEKELVRIFSSRHDPT